MTEKFIGWLVKAEDESGKVKPVSAAFQTKDAAETYLAMYLKAFPDSNPTIEEKVIHSRV